jgi:leucyl aminopeptidase (aminopeptidase T)
MRDPRVERLGELIVSYSLGLEPGKILRIDVPPVAAALGVELYRAALAAGGHPYANVELEQLPEILVKKGNDDQLEFLSPIAAAEIEFVDAIVTIWSESNTRALTRVPPERHQRLIASSRKLAKPRCRSRSTSTSSSAPATSRAPSNPWLTGTACATTFAAGRTGSRRRARFASWALTPTSG